MLKEVGGAGVGERPCAAIDLAVIFLGGMLLGSDLRRALAAVASMEACMGGMSVNRQKTNSMVGRADIAKLG